MDWISPVVTGIATIVVALIAATFADRLTLGRLERVDALLRESEMPAEHRQLLEAVRDRLVERIAYRELRPAYTSFGMIGVLSLVLGLAMLVSWAVDLSRATEAQVQLGTDSALVLIGGMLTFVCGLALLVWLFMQRETWAERTLPSLRHGVSDAHASTDEGGS